MNHRPSSAPEPLLPELQAELARVRAARGFDAQTYIDAKVSKVADYLRGHGLKAAVLGLSGGIDSAVVLGLLLEVKRQFPNVLVQVVPVAMPVHVTAATGQAHAEFRAGQLCAKWDVPLHVYDLVKVHAAYREQIDRYATKPTNWAAGQLVSTIRTPALYYTTSLLTAAGKPAVVVGTTNRDEGAYLGYVGKASDGMVDLQVIADLHKSEVRAVAKVLGVTQEIMDVTPTGDMYDGRVDEEVFGAPYDFVELYLSHLCQQMSEDLMVSWRMESHRQYERYAEAVEALHRYNAHKYLVGSPAVHLNVLESAVPGGWTK